MLSPTSQYDVRCVGGIDRNYNCCEYYRSTRSQSIGSANVDMKSLYCKEYSHHEENKKEAIFTHHVHGTYGPLLICFTLSLCLRISKRSTT